MPRAAVIAEASARFRALREQPHDSKTQAAYRAWLAADVEHAVAADMVATTWGDLSSLADAPEIRALRADAVRGERTTPGRYRALAAGIALVAILACSFVALDSGRSQRSFATARGERLDVALQDGSTLHLNSDTRVDVSLGWFSRDLTLEQGEAEFVVAKDRLRPLTVFAGRMSVRAVGTDFSVRREQEAVSVVLVEGVVAVQPEAASSFAPVTLQPASKAVLAAGAVRPIVQRVDPSAELAWRDGQIVFVRSTLIQALQEFARYTGTSVALQAPEIGRLEISGGFRATDLQGFLDTVSRVHGLRWQRTDNSYRLEKK